MPPVSSRPASFLRYFAYACPDIGGQLIFCVVSFYLLKFYTDVYGLSAATAGTILLIARCIDAVDAPIWGIIFDKTQSRWGKHRPWFLWLCIPFALFGILTFMTPQLGNTAKAVYAGLTYVLCSVLYTGINTPVTSILASLTPDPRERVIFTSFRMFGSKLGVLIVNLSLLKLVTFFGKGDDQRGYMTVLPLFGVCTVLMFLFAFWKLDERVVEEHKRMTIRESFGALKGNGMWFIIFGSSLFFWIAFISRIVIAPYFWEYSLGRADLIGPANSLDFVSLAGILFLPWLVKRYMKRSVWLGGLIGSVIAQFVILFGLREHSMPLIMTGWIVGIIASGLAMALPFSVLSDSVDFGEWKTGIRAAGLLTAVGAAFCLKAGSGLGAAIPAWILEGTGYVPKAVQSSRALFGIELGFIWLPALFYALAAVPVLWYHHYERLEGQIRADLEERRKKALEAEEKAKTALSA